MSTYPCSQCGTLLTPNETVCKTCGRRVIEPTQPADPSSPYPGSPYPSSSISGLSTIEPTQYASPASSSSYDDDSLAAFNPYASLPYEEMASPSAASPPPPASPYAAPPPYAQPLQPKKGPNIGMLIGVGVLLFVLIGGGVLFLAGGQKAPTQGATANTSKNAIAAVATASAMQPLFTDTFADNSKGWNLGNGATISDHTLTLASTSQNSFINAFLPTNNPFGDFLLKVSLRVEQGDQNDYIGLALRTNRTFNQEYHVLLSPDQRFEIGKTYMDSSNKIQEKPLMADTNSSALNPIGQQNTVAVMMKGDHLVLIINNMVAESISDSDYTSGQIALYAYHGSTSNGVKVSFTSVSVYPAPDQLPS